MLVLSPGKGEFEKTYLILSSEIKGVIGERENKVEVEVKKKYAYRQHIYLGSN